MRLESQCLTRSGIAFNIIYIDEISARPRAKRGKSGRLCG
jgi:hypothetical protein